MIRAADCLKKYGQPSLKNKFLLLHSFTSEFQIPIFPKKLYCNIDLIEPLHAAITNIKRNNLQSEIKTFDGCFNIRKARGTSVYSLHSWGIAIDINAFENQLFTKGKLSKKLVKCFTDAGFDWGGDWIKRTDPMHFQLKKI